MLHVNVLTDMIMSSDNVTLTEHDADSVFICDRSHDSGKFGDSSKRFLYCRKITDK